MRQAIRLFFVLTVLTGMVYPLSITLISQVFFHRQANGSLIRSGSEIVGSEWMGQAFHQSQYFWGRPSVSDYDPMASGASNLGPTSLVLKKQIEDRRALLLKLNPGRHSVPEELLMASASGLDPHITPAAALFQMERVAKARKLNTKQAQQLHQLITELTEKSSFFGTERVNVLKLNLAIDQQFH